VGTLAYLVSTYEGVMVNSEGNRHMRGVTRGNVYTVTMPSASVPGASEQLVLISAIDSQSGRALAERWHAIHGGGSPRSWPVVALVATRQADAHLALNRHGQLCVPIATIGTGGYRLGPDAVRHDDHCAAWRSSVHGWSTAAATDGYRGVVVKPTRQESP
jgi:hypothetical protein